MICLLNIQLGRTSDVLLLFNRLSFVFDLLNSSQVLLCGDVDWDVGEVSLVLRVDRDVVQLLT